MRCTRKQTVDPAAVARLERTDKMQERGLHRGRGCRLQPGVVSSERRNLRSQLAMLRVLAGGLPLLQDCREEVIMYKARCIYRNVYLLALLLGRIYPVSRRAGICLFAHDAALPKGVM